jgi:putative ABC transport system permease protein
MRASAERWIRWYLATLLRAYPPAFRERLGEDLVNAYLDRISAWWEDGRWAAVTSTFASAFFHSIRDGTLERVAEPRSSRRQREEPEKPHRASPGKHRGQLMGTLAQDVRFGVRSLRRRPLFTAMAVAILGLGIGSSTAMFSVVHGVLIESPPFRDPGRLVSVFRAADRWKELEGFSEFWDSGPMTPTQYAVWRDGTRQFQGVAAHMVLEMTLTGRGLPRREMVGAASASLFQLLGVQPSLGRWFLPEEEGAVPGEGARVAMLSYDMWRDGFGSDPGVLGNAVTLDDQDYTVVGVLPRGFKLRWLCWSVTDQVDDGRKPIWIPLGAVTTAGMRGYEALGRLVPGATIEHARVEAERLLAVVTQRTDESVRVQGRKEADNRGFASPLVLLLGASGVLLLIACGNVAMLVMGEMPRREREITTRYALGAGAARIVRQLLTESLLLSALGAAAGASVAWFATRILIGMAPALPRLEQVGIDLPVLLFAAVLGAAAGTLFGTAPAILSTRFSLRPVANAHTLRTGGLHRATLVVEMALTVVLLVTAGLFSRSYLRVLSVDPGFDVENVATLQMTLQRDRYSQTEDFQAFYRQVQEGARSVPGVSSVALTSRLPFPGKNFWSFSMLWDETREPDPSTGSVPRIWATAYYVSPGYVETLGIPLLAGRTLTEADNAGAEPVLLVSESLARRYWPDASPVGARIRGPDTHYTVVGVVGDARREALTEQLEPTFYASLPQIEGWVPKVTVVARTEHHPEAAIPTLKQSIWSVDPTVPLGLVGTMGSLVDESATDARYRTFLVGTFGLLAAMLAAAGVFGVTARAVAFRRREMGIRLALGATSNDLTGSTVRATLRTTTLGIVLGLAASLSTGALLADFLFAVGPSDPVTLGSVLLLILAVCLISSYVPARRIAKLNALDILHAE